MTVLQIVANRPAAGKTALAGALLSRMRDAGQRAVWYKPLAADPEGDADLSFMGQLMAGEPGGVAPPEPQGFDPAADVLPVSNQQQSEITTAVAELAAAYDVALVEWAVPATAAGASVLPGYPVLLLWGYAAGAAADAEVAAIAGAAQGIGGDLGGIILNGVTRYREQETEREILEPLRAQGLPVLGAIPESRRMLAPTLQQVADYLDGCWVEEPADLAAAVDRFLIGGNIMDSGPNYFGRYEAQAVITRAGRPDIQMASLQRGTRCLILTGGEEPIEYVRVEARKHGVPLLLVNADTLEAAERLGGLIEQEAAHTREKAAYFADLMEGCLTGWPDSISL